MPSVPFSFNSNTVAQSAQVNSNFTALANAINPTFVFTIVGTIATGTSLTPVLIVPASLTITKAYIYAKTAPTGQALIVDINLNGTSIWNATQANRVQLAATATSGNQTSFDTTTVAEGDVLTIDVDQVGSTIVGADVTVELKCV